LFMERELKILLLEDNLADAELLVRVLKKAALKHELRIADTREEFVSMLHEFKPDVILSDHSLPSFNSLEALRISRDHRPDIPFILVTGEVSEEFAVECMKAGVDDYILKSSLIRLPSSIQNIFSKTDARREKKIIESLHQELQVAYQEIEEHNKSVKDSITYARLIQEAMLPQKEILTSSFAHSFVIYRAKDIVSGDFYWFSERDNKLLLAVADCTGHGVPGALMSMVGNGLLNEIVNVKGITEPHIILQKMNVGLRKALKQDMKENQQGDGMDMALCVIDKKNHVIEFSGANRHLLYFRKMEFELIKGNKHGIGGIYADPQLEFTNHTIPYKEGDIIYMYTDGYADQFGGKYVKRMMTRNLIKLLQHTLSFGIAEQEQLLIKWLENWQGKLEQTDDILLLGVQLK
jgi:sigma-B regulation protein RsbU (phosphoserine phosphatase)